MRFRIRDSFALVLALLLAAHGGTAEAASPLAVHVQNNHLVDADGNVVRLRGVQASGQILPEGQDVFETYLPSAAEAQASPPKLFSSSHVTKIGSGGPGTGLMPTDVWPETSGTGLMPTDVWPETSGTGLMPTDVWPETSGTGLMPTDVWPETSGTGLMPTDVWPETSGTGLMPSDVWPNKLARIVSQLVTSLVRSGRTPLSDISEVVGLRAQTDDVLGFVSVGSTFERSVASPDAFRSQDHARRYTFSSLLSAHNMDSVSKAV
jgi:hypothetical protein